MRKGGAPKLPSGAL